MPVIIRGNFMGGGKIKDATAVSSDVANGKVFYNNTGRCIGTAETVKKRIINFQTGKYEIIRTESIKHIGVYDMNLKLDDGRSNLYMNLASEYDYPSVITNGLNSYNQNIYAEYNLGKIEPILEVSAFGNKRKLVLRELGTKCCVCLSLKDGAFSDMFFNGGNTYSCCYLVFNKKGAETYLGIAGDDGTVWGNGATLRKPVAVTITEL